MLDAFCSGFFEVSLVFGTFDINVFLWYIAILHWGTWRVGMLPRSTGEKVFDGSLDDRGHCRANNDYYHDNECMPYAPVLGLTDVLEENR